MKKVLLALSVSALIFAGCNESDDDAPSNTATDNTIGEADIIAGDSLEFKTLIDGGDTKMWMASGFTLAGLTTFTDCRLDDEMVLNANGTCMYNGGMNLCGAEDNQQVKSGTWELDFANTTILFDKGTSREEAALVIGLSENEIRLDGTYMFMEVRGIYTASE